MPMESVYKPMVLLLAFFIAFSSLTTSTNGHKAKFGIHNARSGEKGVKQEDDARMPSDGLPYPGENNGYPQDLYGSMASMYFPASGDGFQDMIMGKDGQKKVDGQKGSLYYGGYPPYPYGYPPIGYGYGYPFPFPFTGGIFGYPRGIFGFPRGIFGFPPFRGVPGGYGGFPPFRGVPGGYGGFPGGYGGNPGGYGGNPGGYGGNPGGYGSGGPGSKPGGGGYSKAEMKGKEVNSHD